MIIEKLVNKLSLFNTVDDVVTTITRQLEIASEPFVLSFLNAHAVNLCHKNSEFQSSLLKSDLLLRDGSGMSILCKLLGLDPGANLNGTDFIPLLLKRFNKNKISVLGSSITIAEKVASQLSKTGNNVVFVADGFHEYEYYIKQLKQCDSEVVILGMGMPKQETLSTMIKNSIDRPLLVINGGAILDFLSGDIRRAPHWMRRLGIEWLYRLFVEPKRLWRRYVIGNIMFVVRVVKYTAFLRSN